MNVNEMREHVAQAYSGPAWRVRVMYEMSDRQVIAVYHDLKKRGVFDPKNKSKKAPVIAFKEFNEPDCIQMSIWDYMPKKNNEEENDNGNGN